MADGAAWWKRGGRQEVRRRRGRRGRRGSALLGGEEGFGAIAAERRSVFESQRRGEREKWFDQEEKEKERKGSPQKRKRKGLGCIIRRVF
jgi:hypothetical protein